MIEVVKTGLKPPSAPVNPTVRGGDTVYSVVVGRDQETGGIIAGGIGPQMRQAMENLRTAMRAAGGDLNDVAQVLVFLADRSDFAEMNDVYRQYFAEPYPSRATMVCGLMSDDMRVEIVAHAFIPRQS